MSILFISALIFAVFNLIFNFIFPQYFEEILGQTRKIMVKQNPKITRNAFQRMYDMIVESGSEKYIDFKK